MLTLPQTIEQDGAESRRGAGPAAGRVAACDDRDALARLYRLTRTAVYGLALSYVKNHRTPRTSLRTPSSGSGTAPPVSVPGLPYGLDPDGDPESGP